MLEYHQNDERPDYEGTIIMGDAVDDLSIGHTFRLVIGSNPQVVKTTGITGDAEGGFTVVWAAGELNLTPATYKVQLTVTRTSDTKDWTIEDDLLIKARL